MKYVSMRSSKLCRNDNDTPIVLSRKSPLACIKAISDMCNTQKALGWNTNGVARDPLVRHFLDILEKEKVKHKRINYEGRGKSTLACMSADHFLDFLKPHCQLLRYRLLFLLS